MNQRGLQACNAVRTEQRQPRDTQDKSPNAYLKHKDDRFRAQDDKDITTNEAFLLSDPSVRALYAAEYASTSALYYNGQPPFTDLLARIKENAARL